MRCLNCGCKSEHYLCADCTSTDVLDKVFNTRLWDYNVEIWNWGNIGGYICARSILFFGASGLFLIYFLVPKVKKMREKIVGKYGVKAFNIPVIVISSVYILDFIINIIIK